MMDKLRHIADHFTLLQKATVVGVCGLLLAVFSNSAYAFIPLFTFMLAAVFTFKWATRTISRNVYLDTQCLVKILKLPQRFVMYLRGTSMLETYSIHYQKYYAEMTKRKELIEYERIFQPQVPGQPAKKTLGKKADEHSKYQCHSYGSFILDNSMFEFEIDNLIRYIERDFVNSWFKYISDNEENIQNNKVLLNTLALSLIRRIEKVNIFKIIQQFITLFTLHLYEFQAARNIYKQQPKYHRKRTKERTEIKKLETLEDAFQSIGNIHIVLQNCFNGQDEELYLKAVTEALLKLSLLPELHQCSLLPELLVDILSSNVLISLMNLLSSPHWLHKVMIQVFSNEEIKIEDMNEGHKYDSASSNKPTQKKYFEKPSAEFNLLFAQSDITGGSIDPNEGKQDSTMEATEQKGLDNIYVDLEEITHDGANDLSERESPQVDVSSSYMSSQTVEGFDAEALQKCFFVAPLSSQKDTKMVTSKSLINLSAATSKPDFFIGEEPSRATSVPPRQPAEKRLFHDAEGMSAKDQSEAFTDHHPPSHLNDMKTASISACRSTSMDAIATTSVAERNSTVSFQGQAYQRLPIPHDQLLETTCPKLLFPEITVTGAESLKDPSGIGKYTIYVIETLAWHQTPDGSWGLQEGTVKRRYREFLTLQERLEDHPQYKKKLKGISGPSRWKMLPLGSLDSTIEKRKRFLERYLRELTTREDIADCMAIREFLAYDGDVNIAFVKKASERIDKVIVKTVSGVFDKIQAVFPNDERRSRSPARDRMVQGPATRPRPLPAAEDVDKLLLDLSTEMEEEEPNLDSIQRVFESCVDNAPCAGDDSPAPVAEENTEFQDALETSFIRIVPRQSGDGCDRDSMDRVSRDSSIPLTSAILNLALTTISDLDTWARKDNAVTFVKVVLGRAIESWLKEEIDELRTPERCAYYLHLLQDTLWPGGVLDTEPTAPPSEQQAAVTKAQARRCFQQFFPGFLPQLVGQEEFEHSIDVVMACISHERLNRHFAYRLLDLLLETLFPELEVIRIQQELLQRDDRHAELDVQ